MSFVQAPWTEEQVAALERWQASGVVHPFTCVNRGDGKHSNEGGDLGILTPTPTGWICRSCDYRQDWAHDFMLLDPPKLKT